MYPFAPSRRWTSAAAPAALLLALSCGAIAAPYTPADDDATLEPSSTGSSPALRSLRERAITLAAHPRDARLAAEVAAGYLQIARHDSDPRPIGYAETALKPWWDDVAPPVDVLYQRASLKQTVHQFEAALVDLQSLLARPDLPRPLRAQALLTRATVLAVIGRQTEASDDCTPLAGFSDRNVAMLCSFQVQALGRQAPRVADLLGFHLAHGGLGSDSATRLWGDSLTGEVAARLGREALASQAFEAALKEDPKDAYTLAAYADFLLDQGRAAEVRSLLAPFLRADGLLLRHAIALKRLKDPEAASESAQLGARFAAARARGDQTHKREESRYALQVIGDPARALALARDNWVVQKEPADVRVLAEAAAATHSAEAMQIVRDWLAATGLIDRTTPAMRQAASNG